MRLGSADDAFEMRNELASFFLLISASFMSFTDALVPFSGISHSSIERTIVRSDGKIKV